MLLMLFGCKQETEMTQPSDEEINQEKEEKEKDLILMRSWFSVCKSS